MRIIKHAVCLEDTAHIYGAEFPPFSHHRRRTKERTLVNVMRVNLFCPIPNGGYGATVRAPRVERGGFFALARWRAEKYAQNKINHRKCNVLFGHLSPPYTRTPTKMKTYLRTHSAKSFTCSVVEDGIVSA